MYCTYLETSQVSCLLTFSMLRWGCCAFQAHCSFRISCSPEVTPLGWWEGCAQFFVSLDRWRVLAPGTKCWQSSRVAQGMWVVVLTDSWAEPWRPCKVFHTDLRHLPRVARFNSAACYAWYTEREGASLQHQKWTTWMYENLGVFRTRDSDLCGVQLVLHDDGESRIKD